MSPVRSATINGHGALYLDNGLLRVSVLPGKGADIYEIIHIPTGVDCLMKTPLGLRPPSPGGQRAFLDNYEGGWQELFPSGNAACTVDGVQVPFHGEACLLPWEAQVLRDDEGAEVRLTADTRIFPFALSKTLELVPGSPLLRVAWSVWNRSQLTLPYSWGQHLVLGAPFLEAGCVLEVPASTILTDPELGDPAAAKLAAGQAEPWPYAAGRKPHSLQPPSRIDLRRIPGPAARSNDDVFLSGLADGRCKVTNPRLNLAVLLRWNPTFYRYLALWMPYGGATDRPLRGIYGLGVECFTSRDNLAGAIHAGEARYLGPGQMDLTMLSLRFMEATAV